MSNPFIVSHLRNLPLLARVPPAQLDVIADAVEIVQLQPGDLVFRQEQPALGLYLLVNGHALLFSGGAGEERVLGEVNENQYVGESSLFQAARERMSMRVTQSTLLLFLPRLKFAQILQAHPEILPVLDSKFARAAVASAPRDFPDQRPGETLLLFQRRHRWAIVRSSILPVLIGLVLIIIAFRLVDTGLTLPVLMLTVVVSGAWLYYAYIEWLNDYVIITDQRVIHHERILIALSNTVREVLIHSIHEVSYNLPPSDVFARLFGYGTVFLKTAGDSGNIELTLMPHPKHIQDMLISALNSYRENAAEQDRATIDAAIDQILKPGSQTPDGTAQPQTRKPAAPAERPGLLGTRYVDGQGNIIYRKHLSEWSAHVFLPVLFILAAFALFVIGLLLPNPFNSIETLIGPFLGLIGVVWFYWADWDWRQDLLILGETTVRLVHRRPLWLQDISEQVLLAQVDDAVVYRNGILNTLLNRGDLSISLVGDDRPKWFRHVGSPELVKNEIFERRSAMQTRTKDQDLERQRQEIARYLEAYHERMQSSVPNFPTEPPEQPPSFSSTVPRPQRPQPPQPPTPQGPRPPRIPRSRDGR